MDVLLRFLRLGSLAAFATLIASCSPANQSASGSPESDGPSVSAHRVELFDGRVIPGMPKLLGMRAQYEVRVDWLARQRPLLLDQMREHGIEMWIVVSEEFHPDPVTQYVAPPLHYTRRRDVMAFVDAGEAGLAAYSDYWRPTADYRRFFEPLPAARNARGIQDTRAGLGALMEQYDPATIGLNIGGTRGHDSGLTHDSYLFLADALGPGAESRFVSAAGLIEDVFDTRLPEELEHYRQLVLATDVIAQTALSNVVITPGETRATDIKWFFEETIAELGVGGVPWFEIHVAVQRFDPGYRRDDPLRAPRAGRLGLPAGRHHSPRLRLRLSGLRQRLAEGRLHPARRRRRTSPKGLRTALRNANQVHEAFASAPRPGMTGWEATLAIAARTRRRRLPPQPLLTSHRLSRTRAGPQHQRPQHGSLLAPGEGFPPPGRRPTAPSSSAPRPPFRNMAAARSRSRWRTTGT